MTEKSKVTAIIASRPGARHESLRAFLNSLPELEVVGSAAGSLSALNEVNEQRPDLLVIDNNQSEDEVAALIRQVKSDQPDIRCVVLTETSAQKGRALSAGADVALLRDTRPERLVAAIEQVVASLRQDVL